MAEQDLQAQMMEQVPAPAAAPAPKQVAGLETLAPLVKTPEEDFIFTLMQMADAHGVLDESMRPGDMDANDVMDVMETEDLFEFLTREELNTIVQKFKAINPDLQKQMLTALKSESPEFYTRIIAAIKMFGAGEK